MARLGQPLLPGEPHGERLMVLEVWKATATRS